MKDHLNKTNSSDPSSALPNSVYQEFEPHHGSVDLSTASVLVTGGAGFIGSNIVEYLLVHNTGMIRILDNLSEGKLSNIEPFLALPNVEFIQGDITDVETCSKACQGITHVCHQAALGSVPRSIATPVVTNDANVSGFLNVLVAAKDAGIKRVVYASSSSVYGDSRTLPKVEAVTGSPLSPYAVSKCVNELYASVFAINYGMELMGLRYFNIFGPRQKPDGPYAAVIPLFIDAVRNDKPPMINGDGEQSRDFTFVANAVQANIRALFTDNKKACNEVYNVACGDRITVNQLFQVIRSELNSNIEAIHREDRQGDIKHSLADISAANAALGYSPEVDISNGISRTIEWFQGEPDK